MLPGYELIEELAGNDRFRLMRARRVADGTSVLIQFPRHNPPREGDLIALRHEAASWRACPTTASCGRFLVSFSTKTH